MAGRPSVAAWGPFSLTAIHTLGQYLSHERPDKRPNVHALVQHDPRFRGSEALSWEIWNDPLEVTLDGQHQRKLWHGELSLPCTTFHRSEHEQGWPVCCDP